MRSKPCRICSPGWGHSRDDDHRTPADSAAFADIPLHGDRAVQPPTEAAVDKHVAAAASAHWYTPDQLDWHTPEGIDVKPVYIAADRAAVEARRLPAEQFPRRAAVRARSLPDDVCQPAVDDPPIRRVLHGRGVQRVLPPQPGRRPEGPVGGLRPGHPPRLRLRPSARRRATSEWPAWQSIPSWTCGSCSTASTCRRCRCR